MNALIETFLVTIQSNTDKHIRGQKSYSNQIMTDHYVTFCDCFVCCDHSRHRITKNKCFEKCKFMEYYMVFVAIWRLFESQIASLSCRFFFFVRNEIVKYNQGFSFSTNQIFCHKSLAVIYNEIKITKELSHDIQFRNNINFMLITLLLLCKARNSGQKN